MHHPAANALSSSDRGSGPYIKRFGRLERILHLMIIVSFFGLVMTGLPLLFLNEPWAHFLVRMHGGIGTAAIIHRCCAVITFTYAFLHFASLIWKFAHAEDKKEFFTGPNSMIPKAKDGKDMAQMFRYFFGRAPMPKFERYSYLEKFDYWAVTWGTTVIGGTGLLLWFPEFFSRFFPGWIFNVAIIIHGLEALLALVFKFTIHFFNGQLRPDKFPLDLVIFTGRATHQYIEEEHPLEYERLKREGRLAEKEVAPPPRWLYMFAATIGLSAIAIGLTLAVLVIWAIFR